MELACVRSLLLLSSTVLFGLVFVYLQLLEMMVDIILQSCVYTINGRQEKPVYNHR